MSDDLDGKRQEIIAQKQAVTGRISETTRFVGFGLLAVYYAIRTSESGLAAEIDATRTCLVALVGLSGLAAVLLDYLQYWFGSLSVREALNRATVDYDPESIWYKARAVTFGLKQVAAIIGAVSLVIMFAAS